MDRHDLEQVTAKDVAEAHREDLKIQHTYHCKGLTYWYDEERGTAFCLIEAPNAECVKEMHDHAHGLIPHQIIEVESNVVSAFLGRIEDPHSQNTLDGTDQPIINESAFRIIMYIRLNDIMLLKRTCEKSLASKIINSTRDAIQKSINRYKGSEVKKDSRKLIVSFTSAASAVMCALEIQNEINTASDPEKHGPLNVKISLCGGAPVTAGSELFGETIQLAERLCEVANQQQVVLASEVRKQYNNEILDGLSNEIPVQILSPEDENFINRLIETTESIWDDPQFDVGIFGKEIGLSRSQFYRKISSITGFSPNDFIKEFRLKKALHLIENQKGNVTQIAFQSGFNNPSYFAKCFKKRFGTLPSQLVDKKM
jgi:AraC-like DNA-binding protein